MPVETFDYIDSLDPNNPAGFDSVSDGDDHIRGIKSAIKSTFPNITEAVTATAEDLNKISAFAATGNGVFASLKYNGSSIMYGHNIASVQAVSANSYRINFSQPTDGFDNHYSVQLTVIATNGRPVIGMVTDQRPNYVDFSVKELDGSNWIDPIAPIGFYMTMVDMIQTEANANP